MYLPLTTDRRLRLLRIGGQYFPPAQRAKELRALWTERVSLDRSTASPARLASSVGGLRFNAVLVDVAHWRLATDHGPRFECSSNALQQEFRRSRCSPHFVDHVKLLFRMQLHSITASAFTTARGIATVPPPMRAEVDTTVAGWINAAGVKPSICSFSKTPLPHRVVPDSHDQAPVAACFQSLKRGFHCCVKLDHAYPPALSKSGRLDTRTRRVCKV
jgi:hypothetical protein